MGASYGTELAVVAMVATGFNCLNCEEANDCGKGEV